MNIPEGWMNRSIRAARAQALPYCVDLRAGVTLGEVPELLKEIVEMAWE